MTQFKDALKALFRKSTHESTEEITLEDVTIDSAPLFTLPTVGLTKAKVLSVHDGDTLVAAIELFPGKFFSFPVRLSGIDTPELKPRLNIPNRESHIAAAKRARDFLADMVLGKVVSVQFEGIDRYGRQLGRIYLPGAENGVSINEMLLHRGYAAPYFGGTKQSSP